MATFRTALLLTILVLTPIALAGTFGGTYTLANPAVGGFWDDPATWLRDGVPTSTTPGADDTVQLTGSGATVTVRTTVEVATLQQQCTCTLDIAAGAQLTALVSSFPASSTVTGGGTLVLGEEPFPFESPGSTSISTPAFAPAFTVIKNPAQLTVDLTLANLTIDDAADVYGTSNITITGNGNLVGGSIGAQSPSAITITVAAGAHLNANGTLVEDGDIVNHGSITLDHITLDGTLDNRGLLTFVEGAFLDSVAGGTLLNSGTVNVPGNAMSGVGEFVNSGDLIVGSGTFFVVGGLRQVDGGEVRVGGGHLGTDNLDLEGGRVAGTGVLSGQIHNSGGTIDPGIDSDTGQLRINDPRDSFRTFRQSSGGTITIVLNGTTPGTGHDQIFMPDGGPPAQLGGTLDVTLEPGYVPNDGDFFDVFVSESGITGNFDTVNLPSGPGVTFTGSLYTPPGESVPDRYRIVADVAGPAVPDLAVDSNVSPASANTNENVTFTIAVTNNGSGTANGSTLQNVVNGGTVVSSNASQGTCSGTTTVNCNLGAIAAGQTVTVTIVATRSTAGNVTVTSTATAAGDDNDANDSDSATAIFSAAASGADLRITKEGPPVVRQGDTFVYDISVVNDGPDAALDVVVFDSTPNGLTFVSNAGACTTPFPCQLGTIPNGATRTIQATYRADAANVRVSNTATAGGTNNDPVPSNNTSTARTQLIPRCVSPAMPLLDAPARVTAGVPYVVTWSLSGDADSHVIEESATPDFASPTTLALIGTSATFEHSTPGSYYYRVRSTASCNGTSATSEARRVIVTPPGRAEAVVPAGSAASVVLHVDIEGFETETAFTATADANWLTISPASGTLPAEGLDLIVTVDASGLENGTHIATVVVDTAQGKRSIPVTVHVVTPVREVTPTAPSEGTLVIPVVGHLSGVNSHWQSDVRIGNPNPAGGRYAVTLISGTAAETIVEVPSEHTIALDDVAANWFGVGAADNPGSGMLQIRPLDGAPAPIVTSRTYNVSEDGTLGQGVPAVEASDFIGSDGGVLTLQQITQSTAFRTNVGIVEGFGAPATVRLSLFDGNGALIRELLVDVAPFQQFQSNALLAQTAVDNGRIEVRVVNGAGRVTAYASVIDNLTQDPLFVSGIRAGEVRSSRYVFAGAADIVNSFARWRTDLRLFNAGLAAQTATLTFRPFTGPAVVREVTIQPGHVQALDSVLRQTFGIGDTGGAIHVTTPAESNLVVSGRTYNQTDSGTYGQYIPAFLPIDEATAGGATRQLLHVEDSPRYRSNLGIAETRGGNALVQISIYRGDGSVVDTIQMTLAAYEFRQFRIIKDLALGDLYNARITVLVFGGNGAVVSYVSLVDNETQDPTYIAAQ